MKESYYKMRGEMERFRRASEDGDDNFELDQQVGSFIDKKIDFKGSEKVMNLDIDRMLHGTSFYKQSWIREMIIRILFVYFVFSGKEYNQGMHELTALVIRTLYETHKGMKAEFEKFIPSGYNGTSSQETGISTSTFFSLANSTEYDPDVGIAIPREAINNFDLETVSYYMIKAILTDLNSLFDTDEIKKLCEQVFLTMKESKKDQMIIDIYNKLDEYKIRPELIFVRWLRLGFTREFAHKRSQLLWDIMFAHSYLVEGNLFCLNVSFCIELLRVRYHRIVNSTNFTDVVQTLLAPYSDALDSDVITILHSAITSDATRNEKW